MTPHDLDIMWRTVFGEARGERRKVGDVALIAVAWVIWNRVADRRWPDSAAEVCQQPWQFSCWNENDPNREALLAADVSALDGGHSLLAVSMVITDATMDPTNGANHYLTRTLFDGPDMPEWVGDMEVTAIIGGHVFLRG